MQFVIVGGGVAGITAAMDLARRELGEVHVYTDEEYPYYYRPMLTEFLAGTVTMDRLLRHPPDWYAERGVQQHLDTKVVKLDPQGKTITLEDGTVVPYDKLLLAMGSLPSLPPIEGIRKPGVYTWRTLEDTLEIEKAAATCSSTVVIGGGLLGLEAARGLRSFCGKVTVLEYFPRLLPKQLDEEGAALLQRFVKSLGLDVVVGARTQEIVGEPRATGVRLKDGQEFPAQTILVAAGVRSNVELAADAGIEVEKGVVVDDHMATSAPDVFAAGDVAVYKGYSWAIAPIAQAQSRVAAANMVGEETVYDVVLPSTTLKVVGIDVASVGMVNPETEEYEEFRHVDDEAGTYKKIVLRDGTIAGAIIINDKVLARDLEKKIGERAAMTAEEARSIIT